MAAMCVAILVRVLFLALALAVKSSMIIGFSGNLLIGAGLYLAALGAAVAAQKISVKVGRKAIVK